MSEKLILDAVYPIGMVVTMGANWAGFEGQTWQLVDNGSNVVPLEYLSQFGDTTSYCGRATLVPAVARSGELPGMPLTMYNIPIEGTEIQDFTPVIGTTKICLTTKIQLSQDDAQCIANFRFELKEGSGPWTEISQSTAVFRAHSAEPNDVFDVYTVIYLGDSTNDLSLGRTSTVRPTLSFRVLGREYSTTYEMRVNETRFNLLADNSTSHDTIFKPPLIKVVSVGPETQAITYERTA